MNGRLAGTLKGYGYTGTLNEMLYAYYGGTARTLPQRELDWLTAKGYTQGTLQDRWRAFLAPYGAISINDAQFRNIAAAFPPLVSYSFWDPVTKSADVVLSDNNQTMTALVVDQGAKGLVNNNVDKKYFEIQMTTAIHGNVGIASQPHVTTTWVGNEESIGLDTASGNVYGGGLDLGPSGLPVFAINDVVGVAANLDLKKVWFSRNGTFPAGQDPVANTGGFSYTGNFNYIITSARANASFKMRGNSQLFTGTIPSGYSAWNP